MPCYCANKSRSKHVPRSDASDTDEYDHLMQNCLRSDYSGRSSPKYENSSTLDDQAWNDLSSLRQKACRFITSETEETPTEPPATECPLPCDFGYGSADPMTTANDLIDYLPQSEFLKKMKQKCQLLCANMTDICSSVYESVRNDSCDCQMSNESPRTGETPYNSEACGRVHFSQQGMDGCEDETLYENPSYNHCCSTDEKLLDGLIDRRLPNNHSAERLKSANKKTQHISRSKKPSKCRGRRKRKSGRPEKCESENQFEPTLKKPHENSCERCWRYASPSRSPVNKPDQKYDPNFRRGHSCYDFEGGDGEFYDIHVSPCKNLQPITSREKQQSPETVPAYTPEVRQLPSSRLRTSDKRRSRSLGSQRSPDAQPQAFTPTRPRSPEVRPQTRTPTRDRSPDGQPQTSADRQSPESPPQRSTSIWHRSPEPQPQTFSSSYQQTPDPHSRTYTLCQKSPETPPQRSISIWHKSPVPEPQTYTTGGQRSPEPQPQTFSSSYPQTPDPHSRTYTLCHKSPESPPQKSTSIWHRSPVPQPQTYTTCRPKTPESQSSTYHQISAPQPQLFSSTYHQSPESPPQRSVPIWQKSPVPQPQTYTTGRSKTPESQSSTYHQTSGPQRQSFSSTYHQSPESPSQRSTSIWHRSPVPQPQTYTTCQPTTLEPQSSICHQTSGPQPQLFPSTYQQCPESPPQRSVPIWHKSPVPQPQTYTTDRPKISEPQSSTYHQTSGPQPQSFSSTYHQSPESPPQRSVPIWHKSPVPQPQTYTTGRQRTPESQSSTYHQTSGSQQQSFSSTYHQSPESPLQRSVPIWQKSPVPQPQTYTTGRQRTPEPQSSTYYQTSGPQPQSFSSTYHQSPESPPQRSVSIWHKSPVPDPQTYTTGRQRTPEPQSSTYHQTSGPQPQSFSSMYHQSPESPPQKSVSIWHKSPVPEPQTYTNCQPKTPEPQSSTYHQTSGPQPQSFSSMYHQSPESPPQKSVSIWHKSPVPQPQTYPTCQPKTPEPQSSTYHQTSGSQRQSFSSTYHQSPESPPQRSVSIWHKSPVPQPQRFSITRQKSSEAQERQRPQVQRSQSPATPRENEGGIPTSPNAISKAIDYMNVTEFKTYCPSQRQEPVSSSLSATQVYSPSQLTPKPGPVSLGTIPEAAGFDSCKCETPKRQKSNSKTLKEKSPKSPARQVTIKGDSTRQSNSKSSPNRRSESPKKSSRSSPNKPTSGGSLNKSSKSPNRSGNGSTRKCKQKYISPKPESSMQRTRKSPQKNPQMSLEADPKTTRSLTEVNNGTPRTPGRRPQSSDPRREVSPRKIISPEQYLGVDHHIRDCSCGKQDPFFEDVQSLKHVVCCHCDWENHPTIPYSPKSSESKRPNSSYKGYDGRTFECSHRKSSSILADQPDHVNPTFERDCRLLSEVQNTPPFQSNFQDMSPAPASPRKYFMFYMTKCKENKGDDDVEVLVEELTQACPKKTGLTFDNYSEAVSSLRCIRMGDGWRITLSGTYNRKKSVISNMEPLCLFCFEDEETVQHILSTGSIFSPDIWHKVLELIIGTDLQSLVNDINRGQSVSHTNSRTKDLTDKMKKIMECPSDSMALKFQKGVSDQCKTPQSSRVLYF